MIIGDKESFAVEIKFSEQDSQMGYGKLWIQNQFYGTIEDLIYLNGYLLGLIEEILNASPVDFDHSDKTKPELMHQLSERVEENFNYKICGATFTDDFDGYKFKDSDRIYLIWQLRQDQPMVFDELKDYRFDIHLCSADRLEIESVLNELKKKIH